MKISSQPTVKFGLNVTVTSLYPDFDAREEVLRMLEEIKPLEKYDSMIVNFYPLYTKVQAGEPQRTEAPDLGVLKVASHGAVVSFRDKKGSVVEKKYDLADFETEKELMALADNDKMQLIMARFTNRLYRDFPLWRFRNFAINVLSEAKTLAKTLKAT